MPFVSARFRHPFFSTPGLTVALLISLVSVFANSVCASEVYSFGIVPQQSATQLAKNWSPLLKYLENKSGLKLRFATAPDIPTFEKRLAQGEYDFAYMNPYHYTVFHKRPGYNAFARAKQRKLKGIVVVRKDAPFQDIKELDGHTLAFPAPAAFAATVLVQAAFEQRGIKIESQYVRSHDSTYLGVMKGLFPAGGGVIRTFNNIDPSIRDQLRILWTSEGYTPHPFTTHPRIPAPVVDNLLHAMVALDLDAAGKELLKRVGLKALEAGQDSDWDDTRSLDIRLLDTLNGS